MNDILRKMKVPKEVEEIFESTNVVFAKNREELFKYSLGIESGTRDFYEVYYTIEGIGKVVECTVAKCKNGLAINYTDPYMRRRDPNCMVIADDQPTDKETFINRFKEDFSSLKNDTTLVPSSFNSNPTFFKSSGLIKAETWRFKRSRSSSDSIFCETPTCCSKGIYTKARPAILI